MSEQKHARRLVFIVVVAIGVAGAVGAVLLDSVEPGSSVTLPTTSVAPGGVPLRLPGPGVLQCGDGSVHEVDARAVATVAPSNAPLPCTFNQGRQTVCSGDIPADAAGCTCAPDSGRIVCEP